MCPHLGGQKDSPVWYRWKTSYMGKGFGLPGGHISVRPSFVPMQMTLSCKIWLACTDRCSILGLRWHYCSWGRTSCFSRCGSRWCAAAPRVHSQLDSCSLGQSCQDFFCSNLGISRSYRSSWRTKDACSLRQNTYSWLGFWVICRWGCARLIPGLCAWCFLLGYQWSKLRRRKLAECSR